MTSRRNMEPKRALILVNIELFPKYFSVIRKSFQPNILEVLECSRTFKNIKSVTEISSDHNWGIFLIGLGVGEF